MDLKAKEVPRPDLICDCPGYQVVNRSTQTYLVKRVILEKPSVSDKELWYLIKATLETVLRSRLDCKHWEIPKT